MSDKRCDYVILPTKDLISVFLNETNGVVYQDDIQEIVTQILDKLLDGRGIPPQPSRYLSSADLAKLKYRYLIKGTAELQSVQDATLRLSTAIYNLIVRLNLYADSNFPYFFHKLVNNDVILQQFPY